MYAVVEVGGMQWKVASKKTIRVPKMEVEVGKKVDIEKVLLVVDQDKVEIGKPVVPNLTVQATVVSHGKDDKVKVFKKKRRKGYKVLRGHRQDFTELRIEKIAASKAAKEAPAKEAAPAKVKTPAAKKPAAKKAPAKAAAPKADPKKEAKPKAAPAKKAAPKAKPADEGKKE